MEDRTIRLNYFDNYFEDSAEIDVARFDEGTLWISMNRRLASMRAVLTKEEAEELIKNLQDVVKTL
jgi:hypothetical protein